MITQNDHALSADVPRPAHKHNQTNKQKSHVFEFRKSYGWYTPTRTDKTMYGHCHAVNHHNFRFFFLLSSKKVHIQTYRVVWFGLRWTWMCNLLWNVLPRWLVPFYPRLWPAKIDTLDRFHILIVDIYENRAKLNQCCSFVLS